MRYKIMEEHRQTLLAAARAKRSEIKARSDLPKSARCLAVLRNTALMMLLPRFDDASAPL